jgi:hypothetical protein
MAILELPEEAFLRLGLLQCKHSKKRIDATCLDTNGKRFKDAYYACPKSVHDIFVAIQSPDLGGKRIAKPRPSHLLLALRFVKKYPTSCDMSGFGDCTEKTALNRVWLYVEAIQALKEKKVSFMPQFMHVSSSLMLQFPHRLNGFLTTKTNTLNYMWLL